MSYMNTTTRPANIGGIDISGIDVADAIWQAKGGLYGNPSQTDTTSTSGTTPKTSDWVTTPMDSPIADHFDFSKPPADRNDLIKLMAEPEVVHPLMELFKGDDAPVFANGGADGISDGGASLAGAVVVILVVLWAVDHLSDGAVCDALGWHHDGKPEKPTSDGKPVLDLPEYDGYTDPDAMTGDSPSPADMFAGLLAKAGVEGIDTSSPEVVDILGKLSDNMGKVADLVGALKGAAQAGDSNGFGTTLAELQKLAGIDPASFNEAAQSPQDLMDNIFQAYRIEGGQDGAAYHAAQHDHYYVELSTASLHEAAHWITTLDDTIF